MFWILIGVIVLAGFQSAFLQNQIKRYEREYEKKCETIRALWGYLSIEQRSRVTDRKDLSLW
jgi:hypothetical protein